ncbi:MAG: DNA polymerase I [Oligoflexus sp.]
MPKKRLFIIDAMALAFRSYHAFARPLSTSSGMPTQAVYGSLMFLFNLIEKEKPDYLVIATDTDKKTFRHELYDKYKANRSDMPEDMAVQIPYLYRAFTALGCHTLKVPGLEADDLIGSLVHQWASDDLHCYIVSGDKDFMQLINPNVSLYSPKKGGEVKVTDLGGVVEKFGVQASQVIDVLALMGDSSDNVPGVRGIGEKGAAKLIHDFGSLDALYANLDRVQNKRQRTSLEEYKDLAYLSQKLVTIKVDSNIPFPLDETCCDPDHSLANPELLELITELEFRSLQNKVKERIKAIAAREKHPGSKGSQKSPESGVETLDATNYQLVDDQASLDKLISELQLAGRFCIDTETTGLDIIADRPIGISFSWQTGHAYYLPLVQVHLNKELPPQEVIEKIGLLLAKPGLQKIGHNLKFDLQMLKNAGFTVAGPFADTMIASHLLDSSERSHKLDACCLRYLNYEKVKTQTILADHKSMLEADLPSLKDYACEDADLTLRLYEYLLERLAGEDLLEPFEKIEMPLVPVLAKIEQTGIFVDTKILEDLSWQLGNRADELEAKICEMAGEKFNIKSPKQLQVILYEKLKIHEELGIKRLKKTKSGFSTDVSVLEKLQEHPLVAALLEYRTVTKLKSTYVDTLPQLIQPQSNRVHTSFHQTGTATGRLSSSDPNLQNIPIRSQQGREIRKAFRAENKNCVIVSADYSQIELRILAALSEDPGLKDAFTHDRDIHAATAAKIFGIEESAVNADQRSKAKAINFGIIYGMGPQRLARDTGVSVKEAKDFIDRYFAGYPKIKNYIDTAIQFAKDKGYTKTIGGRKRPLPDIHSQDRATLANAQNMAVNSPVQGSAADLIKIAMADVQKKLDEFALSAKMLLQVHDELVFECPRNELDQVQTLIKDAMEHALDIGVPLKVEVGSGQNWLEAH